MEIERFGELDVVAIRRDVTTDEGERVPAGAIGTVVCVHVAGVDRPERGGAFMIEFGDGRLADVDAVDLAIVWRFTQDAGR